MRRSLDEMVDEEIDHRKIKACVGSMHARKLLQERRQLMNGDHKSYLAQAGCQEWQGVSNHIAECSISVSKAE